MAWIELMKISRDMVGEAGILVLFMCVWLSEVDFKGKTEMKNSKMKLL